MQKAWAERRQDWDFVASGHDKRAVSLMGNGFIRWKFFVLSSASGAGDIAETEGRAFVRRAAAAPRFYSRSKKSHGAPAKADAPCSGYVERIRKQQ